jgi:hypothetical protein
MSKKFTCLVVSMTALFFACACRAGAAGDSQSSPSGTSSTLGPGTAPAGETAPGTSAPSATHKARRNKHKLYVTLGASDFVPSVAKTRQDFGNNFTSVGFGIGYGAFYDRSRFRFTVDAIYHTMSNNRLLIVPLSVEYRRPFIDRGNTILYKSLAAGLYPTDIRYDPAGIRAGWRMAYGASAALGVSFERRAFVEGRYYVVTPVRSIGLSGAELSAGYRF